MDTQGVRSRSAKLADDGCELSDGHTPIISKLVKTVEKTLEVGPLLVILVNQLQPIEHALSFLKKLADSLVVGVHSGLDMNPCMARLLAKALQAGCVCCCSASGCCCVWC